MSGAFKRIEVRVFASLRRQPPTGWGRAAFWLLLAYLSCSVIGLLPGDWGSPFRALRWLLLAPLVLCCLVLLFRWIFGHLLWKVRDRLIVTYLLMGLAPLILSATLALLVGYIFFGQFATFAASSAFHMELANLRAENRDFALHVAQALAANPKTRIVLLPDYALETHAHGHDGLALAAFANGRKVPLAQERGGKGLILAPASLPSPPSINAPPAWATNGFEGFAVDGSGLYLRSVESETAGGQTAIMVASLPVGKHMLERLASGLGSIHIIRSDFDLTRTAQGEDEEARPDISGGTLRPARNLLDVKVGFPAPLATVDWATGKAPSFPLGMAVISRPSLLYDRLFTTSLLMGSVIRDAFIGIAIFFVLLELIAFLMAVGLNRTITESIHELYRATTEIDKGDLTHRIVVKRRDQLGALSGSFNRMAASLDRLLIEQREKQRMENELAIAQQVQENLFPPVDVSLAALELHGICRPARTVSGDYYDFLVLGERQLFLALGDISGKGISAALLMATLHSAVRAYQFAGTEWAEATVHTAAGGSNRRERSPTQVLSWESTGLFSSPGKLLELLNRQLYATTQPEKYATLFLAHYDAGDNRLTYANGGHLPPIVLCADGRVKRLDRGGTVVGLIDDMRYEQGSVELAQGDLLIAYSDGVTEPENEFGEFGEERLLEVVGRNRHLPLAAISDQVLQTLRAWIGAQEQPDDITLVMARQH
jgi:phosphoserine phosphatase RsbU/P